MLTTQTSAVALDLLENRFEAFDNTADRIEESIRRAKERGLTFDDP
jgi:ribosome-associated translation inhibitor RaiA